MRLAWTASLLLPLLGAGCVRGAVDRFTTQRVVPAALRVGDVDRACRTGGALGYALAAAPRRTPHRALVIADATAGLCDAQAAMEARLRADLVERHAAGQADVALARDARERADRLYRRAATRLGAAWRHTGSAWPEADVACPRFRERDELTYLVGLVSGTLAMLYDKTSGGQAGVPLDTLARVGRAATCLDDARWWSVPSALEAASWTLVPGSAPPGVEPWEALDQAAERGAAQGSRIGLALVAVLASNAGRDDALHASLTRASGPLPPADPGYALLEALAAELLQHEADRAWIRSVGHRATALAPPPAPPGQEAVKPLADDPFADDPFAE